MWSLSNQGSLYVYCVWENRIISSEVYFKFVCVVIMLSCFKHSIVYQNKQRHFNEIYSKMYILVRKRISKLNQMNLILLNPITEEFNQYEFLAIFLASQLYSFKRFYKLISSFWSFTVAWRHHFITSENQEIKMCWLAIHTY